jgi:hypothetical protein
MRNVAYVQIAQVVLILWHLRARSVTHNVIAPVLGFSAAGALAVRAKALVRIGFQSVIARIRCYWLLELAVGDGVAAGAGVTFEVSIRIFQSSPSRITDQYPLICVGPKFWP